MNFLCNGLIKSHHKIFKSEINVVPLVDVALVLLIIFMITSSFINTSPITVNLPNTIVKSTDAVKDINIEINDPNKITVNKVTVNKTDLIHYLTVSAHKSNLNNKIIIAGNKNLSYGDVVSIIGIVRSVGFTNIVIITKSI